MSQAGVYSSGGPTPPASTPGFGQVYNQTPIDVLPGTNWTFDSNGPLLNISHVLGSDMITINATGTYLITFVSNTSDSFQQAQFLVNGVPVPQASYGFAPSLVGDPVTMNAIVNLNSGDIVQIKNTGPVDVFLTGGAPYTNASITFEKIPSGGASSGTNSFVTNMGVATQIAGIINLRTVNANVIFAGSGNTITQDFALTSNLVLGSMLAFATGSSNVGLGKNALFNLTNGGSNNAIGVNSQTNNTIGFFNTSIGGLTLASLISGSFNTTIGYNSLNALTTTDSNTALGAGTLANLVTGTRNIAIGLDAGSALITNESSNIYIGNSGVVTENNVLRIGTYGVAAGQQNKSFIAATYSNFGTQNAFVGEQSGNTTLTTALAIGNSAVGFQTLQSLTTGAANTVLGQSAGNSITIGNHHTAIGLDALDSLPGGSDCVVVGDSSGTAYNTTESNNIILGANITGSVGESNTVRIGNTSNNRCFVNGIVGNVIVGPQTVVIDPTDGQLGTVSGGGLVTWSVITANQTAVVNNGYFCNKAGTLALALPATSVVGDVIEVININTALGIQFTQAAGQQIFVSTASTTLGAAGTLTSSAVGDTIKLVCRTANTTWWASSIIGNWTPA